MQNYELVYIARQDLDTAAIEKTTAEYEKLIKDNGGEVVKSEYWGLRSLAYKINKSRKGHYQMIAFKGAGSVVEELKRKMKISDSIVREQIVAVDEIKKGASVIMEQNDREAA